jgi:two-component system LytT family response regulator
LPPKDRPLLNRRFAENCSEWYVVRTQNRLTLLALDEIDWLGAAGVYVELHAGGRTYLHRSTLSSLVGRLDPGRFVRVHRSAVVNADRIIELRSRNHGDYTVVLRGGSEVVLSRRYRSGLEAWLGQPLA